MMCFSDIVGQLIQQGMSSASQGRLKHAFGESGLDSLMDSGLGEASANSQHGKQAGGFGNILGSLLGKTAKGVQVTLRLVALVRWLVHCLVVAMAL